MARHVILALAVLQAVALSLSAQNAGVFSQEPKARLPVPDQPTQKEALGLVGEVDTGDYEAAKTPEAKQALAQKLLQAAAETTEAANRYVLLKVARDVAARAADVDLAFEAADAMAAAYQVEAPGMKSEILETALRAAGTPEQQRAVVGGALALVDQAAAGDDYEAATRLGRFALSAARRTRDPKLLNRVMVRNREVEKAGRMHRKVKIALESLERNPGDPEANLTVGRYLCLVKGEWEKGLAMLALGSDDELKALAVKELEGASEPAAQAALGDGWWDLAQKEEGPGKARFEERARHWYGKALPALKGLVKAKVEKRLEPSGPGVAKVERTEKHYLSPENLKNVAFLMRSKTSWKNDARNLVDVQKVPGAFRVAWRSLGGHDWKMLLFANEDVTARKLVAVITIQQGECYVALRSKTLGTVGPAAKLPPGQRRVVELWIEKGVARAAVDGNPIPIDRNSPENYGYFAFVFDPGGIVFFHELRFESVK